MFHAVVGLQFGDEGKGKFVDYLSQNTHEVARFNGGANAGHTVCFDGKTMSFSQLPAAPNAGALYVCAGALISPEKLVEELEFYEGRENPPFIALDPRCHVVLDIHVSLNQASENFKGKRKIGSVGKGIGACVEDRTNRTGLRLWDLQDRDKIADGLRMLWQIRESQIVHVFKGDVHLDFDETVEKLFTFGQRIKPHLAFTNRLLQNKLKSQQPILLETSQGTFLDNIYGTYPYSVSYQSLVHSCFPLMGLPPSRLYVLGVMKAYMVRAGNGPFPTELDGLKANEIRRVGKEYGTVSGRPRRCGSLDLALIKHAVQLHGVTEIAITNVDVLAGQDAVSVCVGYRQNGKPLITDEALLQFDRVKPQLLDFPGWPKFHEVKTFKDFPKNLRTYIEFIEDFAGVPIRYVSYGPSREQTLDRKVSPIAMAKDVRQDKVRNYKIGAAL